MSYEVTATRRRPQKLGDLVGQEFVAETLRNSITSGKIAHAYLFSGPRGCGKTSTARILAKALNCQNGPTPDPCCQCSACQEITKGSSLDVIEIDGASNTSVENIRQIKDEVLFPPSNCRYKIYIIDEVHMLSTSAFNALLKTIEEPPPYVIFIFATTELQKVPATIKSRCQQFNFRLVAIEKVKQCLSQAAAELNIQADDEALFWIARESTGSMRDAYTLFDQVVAFSDGHITYEKIRDKLGLVGIERLNSVFEACAQNQSESVITALDEFLQGGISIEQLISNCADYLRSLLLIKSGITKESLLGNSAERYSRTVLSAWNSIQIERALSIFLQLYRDIRYSLSPRYELELAFSRLCWIGQYVSNVEVKKAIDAAQNLLLSSAGAAPAQEAKSSLAQKPEDSQKMMFAQPQEPSQIPASTQAQVPEGSSQMQAASQNASLQGFSSETQASSSNTPSLSIPNGLPRLSMLDSDSDLEETPPDNSFGEEANPFLNGGLDSLPPEQTVNKNQTAEPKELDERLKINISSKELQIKPEDVIKTSAFSEDAKNFGYSLNPDEAPEETSEAEDDGWTNVDEPPPEPYYGEDEDFTQEASFGENPAFTSQAAEKKPSPTIVTSSGPVTLEKLRTDLIAAVNAKDNFAAASLEKTRNWRVNGLKIEAELYSEYEKSLLQKKLTLINQELLSYTGTTFELNLMVKEPENSENGQIKAEIPAQVRLLVDIFKGTLVGR